MGSVNSSPYDSSANAPSIPLPFLRKRLHSLTGLFLLLFLLEHLLTNSQAALWIEDDGFGFVEAVNWIHSLPYLHVIEVLLLAIPFFLHALLGIFSIREASINSVKSDGSQPSLPQFSRNRAFTWQRITAILILAGLSYHVISMRFLRYPETTGHGFHRIYSVFTEEDPGLVNVVDRLGALLVTENNKNRLITKFQEETSEEGQLIAKLLPTLPTTASNAFVVTNSFGMATLFSVRDVFRSPSICIVYTLFVLATIFHAGNGLWTAMITWGVVAHERGRRFFRFLSYFVMALLLFFGMSSIWLTYFVTLYT